TDIFYYLLREGHLERAFETATARGRELASQPRREPRGLPGPYRPGPERAAHAHGGRAPLGGPDAGQHAGGGSPRGDAAGGALPPHPPRRPPRRALDGQ